MLHNHTSLGTQDLDALRELLDEAIGQVGEAAKAASPTVYGINPFLPYHMIAERLWRECGRRKALLIRTRLSQLAEAQDGLRQPRSGRDRVMHGTRANANGNGVRAD
jgi:hypothetical protein